MLQVLEGPMLCQLIEAIPDSGVPFTVRIGKTNKKLILIPPWEGQKKLLDELPPKLSYCQPEEFSSKVENLLYVCVWIHCM